jgi:hypothetical protein
MLWLLASSGGDVGTLAEQDAKSNSARLIPVIITADFNLNMIILHRLISIYSLPNQF